MTEFKHISVLLKEAIELLSILPGKKIIDATLGGAGHTKEMLNQKAIVLGIERDKEALEFVQKELKEDILNKNLHVVHGNFRDIEVLAMQNGFEKASAVLFDLGVSSYQLDTPGRGFSIKHNAPLDMRMNKDDELTAFEIVNSYSEEALREIFTTYGEEDQADKIATEIVSKRKEKKIETTHELVAIIESIIRRTGKLHPATKVFQALRIEVNRELEDLRIGLSGALNVLGKDGKVAVISFHSLEDRIVKRTFEKWEQQGFGKVITKKPIVAKENELLSNPRARSAKLRGFQKI